MELSIYTQMLAIGIGIALAFLIALVNECKSLRKENERIKKVYEDSIEKQCIMKKRKFMLVCKVHERL